MRQRLVVFGLVVFSFLVCVAADAAAVEPEKLKALLPSKPPRGYVVGSEDARTVVMGPLQTSFAQLVLRTDPENHKFGGRTCTVNIRVSDLAELNCVPVIAEMAQGSVTKYKGFPCVVTQTEGSCRIRLMVGGRFMVELNGYNFSNPDILRSILKKIDIKQLSHLA